MVRNLYFWRERPNFGDLISPVILAHFGRVDVTWSPPEEADTLCVGSVLDIIPQQGFRGTVVGAGKLLAATETDLTAADVLGLRGPLTLEAVKLTASDRANVVLGDPGLLVSDLVNVTPGKYDLGCVPHCSDKALYARELARSQEQHYPEPVLIDPAGDPLEVVAMIGSCAKVISSSLHGIITADAFGIPRRTEMFAEMQTNRHQGGWFKFLDYGQSIGQPVEFGTLQQAPQTQIEQMQYELFDMFQGLKAT